MINTEDQNTEIFPVFSEDNTGVLHIFTAIKIRNKNNKTIGITGMEFVVNDLRDITNIYDQNSMDTETYLVDAEGNLLYTSQFGQISDYNVFTDGFLSDFTSSEIFDPETDNGIWFGKDLILFNSQQYCRAMYIPELNAYLLILNKNSTIRESLNQQVITQLILIILMLITIIILVDNIIRKYRLQIINDMDTDELTKLPTRKSFSQWYTETADLTGFSSSSMFLLDIDHFKNINDTRGHAGGDEALYVLAQLLNKELGDHAIMARWGGDEFIGVIPQPAPTAWAIMEKIRNQVASSSAEDSIPITISVGIIPIDSHLHLNQMAELADSALYEAKKRGRNNVVLSDYHPLAESLIPDALLDKPPGSPNDEKRQEVDNDRKAEKKTEASSIPVREIFRKDITSCILYAVKRMTPFVAGGGFLIAISYLIDAIHYDINELNYSSHAFLGSLSPLASALKELGSATFQFMLPIFSGFFCYEMVGADAFLSGFIGGYLIADCNTGFIGALLIALLTSFMCYELKKFNRLFPPMIQTILNLVATPVFSLLFIRLLTFYLIAPASDVISSVLQNFLHSLSDLHPILTGAISSGMMAIDMGGILNKAAYSFGTFSIVGGQTQIMASVMLGGMVPPLGVSLCAILFRDKFSKSERRIAPVTFVMGLSFITEGVLPYVFGDIWRVITASIAGSLVAGALCALFDCKLPAPHGGIVSFPLVNYPMLYLLALFIGSLVTAFLLYLLKKTKKSV